MEQFSYKLEELTQEQLECIDAAQQEYESAMKRLIEDEDSRMQNYYDCIDDYSWGGLCTKANYIARDRERIKLEDRIEEIVRGGYLVRERKENALKSIETGEIVARGTHQGKFGRFFATDDGKFVSCTKLVKTYEKKGYIPLVLTITEKKVRDGVWPSGDQRYKTIDTLSVEEEVSTQIVY